MHEVTGARWTLMLTAAALFGAVFTPFAARGQGTGAPTTAAIASAPLLANDRLSAIKLSFPPGAHEAVHSHPFDIVVIQLTPGEVDFVLDGKQSIGAIEAGRVTYVPAQAPHSAGNVGKAPLDMVVIALR